MIDDGVTDAIKAWSGVLGSWHAKVIKAGRIWEITGRDGARYVLKQIWSEFPDPHRRFLDEARILSHLAHCGLPVAVPVPCDRGPITALGGDGHHYALAPKLAVRRHQQESLAGDPAEYRNVGAAVARMHLALKECPYGVESFDIEPPALRPETWQLLEKGLRPDVFAELRDRINPWQDAIEACVDDPAPQRVHGDVHGGNILIDDDHTVSGIIDVDHLPIAPRIYDLGYYQMFGIEWAYQRGESAAPIEHATTLVAQNLIAGYNAVSLLTDREIDALPAMALYTAIGLIRFFLRTEGSVGDTWIDTARWITDHPDRLHP